MSHSSSSYDDDKKRKADSYRDEDERKSKREKSKDDSRYRDIKERDRKKDRRDEKVTDADQEKRRKETEEKSKASTNQSAEEKKKRLEAWKKLMAEQNLAPTTTENTEANSLVETKENKDAIQVDTPAEPVIDLSSQTPTPTPTPEKSDEVDPLDAFMMEIQQQVRKDHGNMLLNSKQQGQSKGNGSSNKQSSTDRYYSDEESGQIKADTNGDEDGAEGSDDDESPLLKKLRKKNLSQVDHSKVEYPPFKKNFYIEVPEIARMTPEEANTYREEMENIRIRGKDCPKPIKSFTQCGLSNKILKVMEKSNYSKPTPIQAQSIPAIMSGRDVIGCAKTGSGKTLAFLLPMLRHISDQPPITPGDGPIGLVMAPTRELAMQIHAEFKKFTKPLALRCVCVYGGSGVASQIADLKRGAEIVVCTPGRMIDVLCTNAGKVTNLQRVTYLVLDEADRMFDMGFEPQIMRIINNIRPDRQTVMFSATFPRQVESLARKILTRPLEIVVGARSIVCSDVEQHIEVLPEDSKFRKLLELLKTWHEKGNIIIFVDRQESADKLFTDLVKADYPALALHGGMNQQDRDFTIDDFKRKVKTILVATSVAARGLDVKDLNLVINYDVPNHMEDYVHRVGRTGRAGAKGTAITFITPDEERFAPDIAKAVENSGAAVPPELQKLCDSFTEKKQAGLAVIPGSGYGGKGFKFDEAEEQKRQEERKRQMRTYGMEEGFLVEEEQTELFEDDEEAAQGEKSNVSKDTTALTAHTKGGNMNPASLAQKLAQEIANKAKAQIAAASAEHFTDELEINDFPQQARWKVTHKDSLASITEFTNTAITTRGNFIPPGRNPAPGERKLYLVIEGPDVISVKKARAEILRILEETTLISGPDKTTYGKYKVV